MGAAPKHSIEELQQQVATLGVVAGDTVMLHASLDAIGETEQRADGLLRALELAVGASGTLLMVLGAKDDWAWVHKHPEHEREALLAAATPFDAHTTPAHPDVGLLAELFRQRTGTFVSTHPEGRFAARGDGAEELVADQPWNDYYGPGSPLERLLARRGKILRMGADLDTVTAIHYAEYLCSVPNKRRVSRHRRVATTGEAEIRRLECLDDEDGIVEHPGEDYFATILRAYLATGTHSAGFVGSAQSELIDANELVRFAVDWMDRHLS